MQGTLKPRDKILLMATGALYNCEQVGVFTPKAVARDELSAGGVGFIVAGIKEIHAAKVGDTVTLASPPGCGCASGLQERQATGVRGPLSRRVQPVRGAAQRTRQAEAQRRVAALRARSLAGARIRLPLRLPRPSAHGHRAGAARARVRHGPDHDRADGDLPGPASRRNAARDRESVEAAGSLARRGDPRADHHDHHPDAAGIRGAGDNALHRAPRTAEEHAVPRSPGHADLRAPAGRGGDGFLRPPQVCLARLRIARLRVQGVQRRRRRQAGHPHQWRARRRAVGDGPSLGCHRTADARS